MPGLRGGGVKHPSEKTTSQSSEQRTTGREEEEDTRRTQSSSVKQPTGKRAPPKQELPREESLSNITQGER